MGKKQGAAKFTLPPFQGKLRSFFQGKVSIEKRTRFLQDYMNGLFTLNGPTQLKFLFKCTLFDDFIDLISKSRQSRQLNCYFRNKINNNLSLSIEFIGHAEIKRKLLKHLNELDPASSSSIATPILRKSHSSSNIGLSKDLS